ncbi:MAG: helix-turn-helix transcriptional regulator [Acidimicrobiales bacterium]
MPREPVYERIGRLIRTRRRARDLSQLGLAGRLGLARATLANMESGRQRILAHQLYQLADALECRVEDLLPPPPTRESAMLTFSESLSDSQREQISHLIDTVQVPSRPAAQATHATADTTRTRQTRR